MDLGTTRNERPVITYGVIWPQLVGVYDQIYCGYSRNTQ